jgi:hypothetical protein
VQKSSKKQSKKEIGNIYGLDRPRDKWGRLIMNPPPPRESEVTSDTDPEIEKKIEERKEKERLEEIKKNLIQEDIPLVEPEVIPEKKPQVDFLSEL